MACLFSRLKQKHTIPDMKVWRPGTTDEKVIDEVLRRNVYERKKMEFHLNQAPVWLDLGANIGTFSLKATTSGCRVVAYEPEPENFNILVENTRGLSVTPVKAAIVASSDKSTQPLYLCKGDYNKYRHTLTKIRGRLTIDVDVHIFKDVLDQFRPNGVKMDIEGAEIDILDSMTTWPTHVTHLVFEYSFDRDRSITRFKKIIDQLKENFTHVHHPKMDWNREKYDFYPPAVIVYAKR